MRVSGHLIAAIAAIGFAGMGVGPGLADTHERSEMKALERASLSLEDAASAAEKQAGGVVVAVVFHEVGGVPSYDVMSMNNGTMTHTKVDAMTGEVTSGTSKQPGELTADERGITTAQKPRMTVQQATMAAEQEAHGKAIESDLTMKGGNVVYEVDVVTGDEVKHVIVDPATGSAIMMK